MTAPVLLATVAGPGRPIDGGAIPLIPLNAVEIALILATYVLLHLIVSAAGFALHLKEQPV